MASSIIACNLTVIRSNDLERAATFYRALGLSLSCHSHSKGPTHYAFESVGHTFELYPLKASDLPTSSTRVGFAVSSVDDAYSSALAAGAESIVPPSDSQWGRRAVVADPDGHRIELTESVEAGN